MPIYEYKCIDCQAEFEDLIMNAEKETATCPACKSTNTEKTGLSAFGGIGSSGCGGSCGGCGGSCH